MRTYTYIKSDAKRLDFPSYNKRNNDEQARYIVWFERVSKARVVLTIDDHKIEQLSNRQSLITIGAWSVLIGREVPRQRVWKCFRNVLQAIMKRHIRLENADEA